MELGWNRTRWRGTYLVVNGDRAGYGEWHRWRSVRIILPVRCQFLSAHAQDFHSAETSTRHRPFPIWEVQNTKLPHEAKLHQGEILKRVFRDRVLWSVSYYRGIDQIRTSSFFASKFGQLFFFSQELEDTTALHSLVKLIFLGFLI